MNLLPQIVFVIGPIHCLAHALLNPLFQTADAQLAADHLRGELQAQVHVEALQHLLLVLDGRKQVSGDAVAEGAGHALALNGLNKFGHVQAPLLDELACKGCDGAHICPVFRRRGLLRQINVLAGDFRLLIGAALPDGHKNRAQLTLHHQAHGLIRQGHDLANGDDGADRIEIGDVRRIHHGIPLRHHKDAAVALDGLLHRGHGLLPAHVQRGHAARKDHHAAQRQQRQIVHFTIVL